MVWWRLSEFRWSFDLGSSGTEPSSLGSVVQPQQATACRERSFEHKSMSQRGQWINDRRCLQGGLEASGQYGFFDLTLSKDGGTGS